MQLGYDGHEDVEDAGKTQRRLYCHFEQLPQIECVASIPRPYKYVLEDVQNDNAIFSGSQMVYGMLMD